MASQPLEISETGKPGCDHCPYYDDDLTSSSRGQSIDLNINETTLKRHTFATSNLDVSQTSQIPDIGQNDVNDILNKFQYQYRPLENNETIRILTLHPGKQSDQLVGTIEVVSIQSAVPYETLSYVWADAGPPNNAGAMMIRGKYDEGALLVLRGGSIVAALHRLRLPDRPRRIWTDQCCINQDDLEERSRQVQFMDQIYRNSTHVLVWLGSDAEKMAILAFDTVRELDKILGDDQYSDRQKTELVLYVTENQKALQALTSRTWFTRGWIVQEIGTTTPATLHWGDAKLDWDMLASVCERLKGYHHLRSVLGISTSDVSFLHRRFIEPDEKTHHANRFNFLYELQRSRHLQFSDDRDRVFAFLGHFSLHSHHPLACQPLSIAADYTKTVAETYIDLAVRIMRQSPQSAYILLASVQHGNSILPSKQNQTDVLPTSEGKLPSWVPDWRQSEGIILAEPICPHRAHADSTAKIQIFEKPDIVLRIYGMEIDTIQACSRRLVEEDLYGGKMLDGAPTMIEKLWHEICQKENFNLRDAYRNGQAALFAFMQTLANGCVQAAGHKSMPYHDIPEEVWLRKAARYIVDALGTNHPGVSKDVQNAAEDSQCEAESESWSRWATCASHGRIFARTGTGYYVLGPGAMEAGDVVCVFLGGKVPFCLRPVGSRCLLVGECYVYGLMKGEAMEKLGQNELREVSFDII